MLVQRWGVLPFLPSSPGCYTLEQTRVIMDKTFVLITDCKEVTHVLLITEGYDFDPRCVFTVGEKDRCLLSVTDISQSKTHWLEVQSSL